MKIFRSAVLAGGSQILRLRDGDRCWKNCLVIFSMAWMAAAGTCKVAAQDTNCADCWAGVTRWHGTWNLTLTGSGVNNSSQGTFDISNGVSTVTGSGSVSSSVSGCCSCNGSGSLDSSSSVSVFLDTTNCTYTLVLADWLPFTLEYVPPGGSYPSMEPCSGGTASPNSGSLYDGFGVLPYFPLPAYGDSLVQSGTYTASNPRLGCYVGGDVTLTISWNIEPIVASGAPQFTRLPAGASLGCNPTNIPDTTTVLKGARATAPSNQVSISCGMADVTNGCAVTRSFTLTATDNCTDQKATALVVYSWTEDTSPPVITGVPAGGDLGCNPASPPTDATVQGFVTVIDDCDLVSPNVTHTDTTNGCTVTRMFTITAVDGCGNTAGPATAVYTWTMDTTPPVITGVPSGASFGCNPTDLPTDASVLAPVQVTDDCGTATKNVSHADVIDGCMVTRTFTISAADNCGNHSERTVQYTWTSDTTPPAFIHLPPGGDLGTNPPCLPGDGAVQAQCQVLDNCGVSSVKAKHVDSGTTNLFTRKFTITAKDFCGNSSAATVVYTWSGTPAASLVAPVLNIQSTGTNVLLSWPTNADCFCLITSTGLTSEVWTAITNVPIVSGSEFMVTNNANEPGRIYRLAR